MKYNSQNLQKLNLAKQKCCTVYNFFIYPVFYRNYYLSFIEFFIHDILP